MCYFLDMGCAAAYLDKAWRTPRMTDEEFRDRAADAAARSFGDQLHKVLKAVFLAGAEWERNAIIRRLEGKDGRPSEPDMARHEAAAQPRTTDPVTHAPDASAEPRRARTVLRRAGTKRPSTADDALAVIDRAGDAGITAAEILVKLRGDAPHGGQRDNTVSKALRRLRRDKMVRFDGTLYRRAID